ncbi:MAG: acyl-CoA desaturase [Myxococcota bacterium]
MVALLSPDRSAPPALSPVASAAPASLAEVPATTALAELSLEERQRRLGLELDALKRRVMARLGADDVRYVKRLDRLSKTLEGVGRALIQLSPDPLSFGAGVVSLWLHKQLQATEIGHTALHGAYDKLPGAEAFASTTFAWDVPIDEESWRAGHNLKHHGHTNIAGKDPDVDFGLIRLTEHTPHSPHHRRQLWQTLFFLVPNFTAAMNLHFTGLSDVFRENGHTNRFDVLPDRSEASVRLAWRRTLRKYVPYYLRNYVAFPALAGPLWPKVLLGNWLAETLRDVYTAATILCGHVGADVASWPEGAKATSRGAWYAMQIEASNDFEVPRPLSILCGGLDRQIEHHLFPTLPPERLRQIAPEVRAIAERHGFRYRTGSWPRVLRQALGHIARLAKDGGARRVLGEVA